MILAVYKLHESQKVLVCQLIWYLSINYIFAILFYVFFRRRTTHLHIRDIICSAYICNTLYSAVKQTFYSGVKQQFVTERCQCANVWKSQSTCEGAFVREGTCPRGTCLEAHVWGPFVRRGALVQRVCSDIFLQLSANSHEKQRTIYGITAPLRLSMCHYQRSVLSQCLSLTQLNTLASVSFER